MNEQDREIATRIWPQYMNTGERPYGRKIEAAKRYLGDKYLCARPINASRQKAPPV